MSAYPSNPSPYGVNYGAQDQTNPPYLPPTYPTPYMQPSDGRMEQGSQSSSYDASSSGYGYNGPVPPFSASALASGVPPLPIYQGWNQDPIPLPPYNNTPNGQQYINYSDQNAQNAQYNSQYYVPTQPTYQPNPQPSRPYEEREVSEGEFNNGGPQLNNSAAAYVTNQYSANSRTPYAEVSQQPTYSAPTPQNQQRPYHSINTFTHPPRDSPQTKVQQTDMYSPRNSPKAPDHFDHAKENQKQAFPNANANSRGRTHTGMRNPNNARESSAGRSPLGKPDVTSAPKNAVASKQQSSYGSSPLPLTTEKSVVAEARKRAQAAILNLLPLNIHFQTYIDEGFNQDLVGPLFDDLKISRTSAKPSSIIQNAGANSGSNGPKGPAVQTSSIIQQGNPPLAIQMNGKMPTTNGSVTSKIPTATIPNASGKTDKEKTLQSKMEALRKSREDRAQKAAAKNVVKSPIDTISSLAAPSAADLATTSSEPQVKPIVPAQTQAAPITRSSEDEDPLTTSSNNIGVSAPTASAKLSTTVQIPGLQIPGLQIPGLSYTAPVMPSVAPPASSAPAINGSGVNTPTPTPQNSQRKRPVAADFDSSAGSSTPYKRPFGQSRNEQRLVIDVSDEEMDSDDEDVAMDLESQADPDSPVQAFKVLPDNRSTAAHNLPSMSDFCKTKPFTPPPRPSAANSPPNTQSVTPGAIKSSSDPRVLQRKESEIEQLKKKIAEAEAKKRARQTPTGSQTPRAVEERDASNVTPGSNVEASMKMQKLISIADNNVSFNQQKLSETHSAELVKEAELKKSEDERKRLRLQKIASDLPLVDAQVLQSQSKLEQLRAETGRLEEEVRKILEEKRLLAEEMERLGKETEEQLQAQREKLQSLTEENGPNPTLSHSPPLVNVGDGVVSSTPHAEPGQVQSPPKDFGHLDPVMTDGPNKEVIQSSPREPSSEELKVGETSQGVALAATAPATIQPVAPETADQASASANGALEGAIQEAVRAEEDRHTRGDNNDENEANFSPSSAEETPQTPFSVEDENGSPAYSPVLQRTISDVLDVDMDGESDGYEPPEASPPVDEPSPLPESPPFSPAPPKEHLEAEQADDVMEDSWANDVEQAVVEKSGTLPAPNQDESTMLAGKTERFTAYESPLQRFRARRFHPDFKNEVVGGLRSLTYSHRIDPDKEFCRFELAGGICNDSTCEFQHFKTVGLPDDAVLTALGSPEQFSPPQREKFCDGLRAVLTDLRARKIRDFDLIAAEIIAHRAKFLDDPSNFLNLDTTL